LSAQALYDFDGTITSRDTTIFLLFELLKLRPWRFFGLMWFLFRMIAASGSVSKQEQKNKAIGYLIKDLNNMRLSGALNDFKNKVEFLYRPSILASIDQAVQGGNTVLIVTASPSFAVSHCMSELPVIVIGTDFEKKRDNYTGLLKSENCYGPEKVNRLNDWAKSNNVTLSVQSAWSDHFSDFDMLSLSAKRYWVGGEPLRKLVLDHDPMAEFIHMEQ
jgi:phosphatidylglycerophosphatase C